MFKTSRPIDQLCLPGRERERAREEPEKMGIWNVDNAEVANGSPIWKPRWLARWVAQITFRYCISRRRQTLKNETRKHTETVGSKKLKQKCFISTEADSFLDKNLIKSCCCKRLIEIFGIELLKLCVCWRKNLWIRFETRIDFGVKSEPDNTDTMRCVAAGSSCWWHLMQKNVWRQNWLTKLRVKI